MSLQELHPSERTPEVASPTRDIGDFDYLGPDTVTAWSDLTNVGKLCEKCEGVPWDDILEIRDEQMRTSWHSFEVRPSDFMEERRACAPSCVCSHEFQDSGPLSFEDSLKQAEFSSDASSAIQSSEPGLDPAGYRMIDCRNSQIIDAQEIPGYDDHSPLEDTFDSPSDEQPCKEYLPQRIACNIEDVCRETLQRYELRWALDPKNPKSVLVFGNIDTQLTQELLEHTKALKTATVVPEITEKFIQKPKEDVFYYNSLLTSSVPEHYDTRYGPSRMDENLLPPSQSGRLRSKLPGLCVSFWIQDDAPTVAYVRDSAHKGCHLCTLILNTWLLNRSIRSSQIEIFWPNGPDLGDDSYAQERLSLDSKNDYLFGQARKSIPPERKMRFGFDLLFESQQNKSDSISGETVSITDSAESIAKWWVEECLLNHGSTCGVTEEEPVLPSRVVDVRGRGKDATPFIFQSGGKRARYATLSYCWGKCVLLTSTVSNISHHREGIPLSTMPKSFQDAITMTSALGLQYLWIDALCILQDSLEDCQKELGSMAQIYAESTVTLAVISGDNANSGFSLNRNKLAMLDCRVSEDILVSANLEGQEKQFESGTIHERAWCFQEVQISPRLLSCGGREVYFQCRRGLSREGSPLKKFLKENGDEYIRLFDQVTSSSEELYSRWLTAVEAFTSLNITFPDDRLPAISGLAARFPSLFENQAERPSAADYFGGLWRVDLLKSLSWIKQGRYSQVKNTEYLLCNKYRAPSWSWGAVNGPIDFSLDASWKANREDHPVAEVFEVWATPVSDLTAFGPVRAGKLVMWGPVAKLPQEAYNNIESDYEVASASMARRKARQQERRRRRSTRYSDSDFYADPDYEEKRQTSVPAWEERNEYVTFTEENTAERPGSGYRRTVLETDEEDFTERDVYEKQVFDLQTRETYREVITQVDYGTRIVTRDFGPSDIDEENVTYRTRTIEVSRPEHGESNTYSRRIRRLSNEESFQSREQSVISSDENKPYMRTVTRRVYDRVRSASREILRDKPTPEVEGDVSYTEVDHDAVDYNAGDSEDRSLVSKEYYVERVYYREEEDGKTYRETYKVMRGGSESDSYKDEDFDDTRIVRREEVQTGSHYDGEDEQGAYVVRREEVQADSQYDSEDERSRYVRREESHEELRYDREDDYDTYNAMEVEIQAPRPRSPCTDEDSQTSSRRSPRRKRRWSPDSYDSEETDHPSGIKSGMVSWDFENPSRDINCVCLLLTPSVGLILSPVRKPGAVVAGGIYQRVGTFRDWGWEKRRRQGEYREGHPGWEYRVVTIL